MGKYLLRNLAVSLAIALASGVTFGGATWVSPTYTLNTSAHISAVGQVRTGSINLTVNHDAPCTLTVAGNPTLTNGSSTLATAYKLTGPGYVTNRDVAWVPAATFLTHSYGITNPGPATTLTLDVQATPPPDAAPDAGVYTATVTLTVSW